MRETFKKKKKRKGVSVYMKINWKKLTYTQKYYRISFIMAIPGIVCGFIPYDYYCKLSKPTISDMFILGGFSILCAGCGYIQFFYFWPAIYSTLCIFGDKVLLKTVKIKSHD